MDRSLTIEKFHTLLTSGSEDSLLLAALRELAAIQKAEKIVTAILESEQQWTGE